MSEVKASTETSFSPLDQTSYDALRSLYATHGSNHGYNLSEMPTLAPFPARKSFRLSNLRLDEAMRSGDQLDSTFVDGGRRAALDVATRAAKKPPAWIDMDRVRNGQRMGRRYFSCLAMTLGNLSLIGGFGASKINRVLVKGSRLSQVSEGRGYDPLPRLVETSAWLLEALRSVEPGSRGFDETLKVRVLHAMIRQHLLQMNWDVERFDYPINQEQMLATLMGFSYNGVWGLRRMGITLSDREAEDYIHLWAYIGHMLGIDDDLLPRSYEESRATTLQMLPRLIDPDDETREIIENLHDRRESNLGLPRAVQAAMCRFYLPHRYADELGLPGIPIVDRGVAAVYRCLGTVVSTIGRYRPDALERWEVERVSQRLEFVLDSIRRGESPAPQSDDLLSRGIHTVRGVSRALLSV